jgi:hypothetical protein
MNKAIMAMASDSQDGEHHNIVSVIHHTLDPNGNGGGSIELKFNPVIASNNKYMVDDEKLSALAGKTITMPIAPDASGPTLRTLPSGSNSYMYGQLLSGKTFNANPIAKSLGFDYTVKPDDPDHPQGAYVYVNRSVFKNGSKVPVSTKPIYVPFSGPQAKNPDEIMNYINQAMMAHMNEDDLNRSSYQKQFQTGNGKTINDIIDGK